MPFTLPDLTGLTERLHADLTAARYTAERIDELLSPTALAALEREDPIPARRELDQLNDPAATLFSVFTLGGRVRERELAHALPSLTLEGAQRLGIVEPIDVGTTSAVRLLRATIDLRPYQAEDDLGGVQWWIASDLSEIATGRPLDGDHVLGVGGATTTLVQVTPRPRVERALDVGCGCGIQALHAARHARTVIATDISQRALNFTRFNIALNQGSLPEGHTIELRQGSMLEPVAGEQFNLVVSNPPFVITPRLEDEQTWTYRDGGQVGDHLLAELVRALPEHLSEGGLAVMLANWEIPAGADWDAHPRLWLQDTAADAFIIQREIEDPAAYAHTWLRDGGLTPADPRWETLMHAYLDDFSSREVDAVGFGYVLLHRPAEDEGREPLRVLEDIRTTGRGPLGPRLLTMLSSGIAGARLSDEQLLAARIRRADDVVERRHFTPGAEDPLLIDAVQGGGFGRTLQLSSAMAGMLGVMTGEHLLGVLLNAYLSLTDEDPQALRPQLLEEVRRLLLWDFLTFAAPEEGGTL